MEIFKAFAIAMAHEAGAILKERFGAQHAVDYKGAINLVTEVDRLSEEQIKTRIRNNFPDHGILAEESAELPGHSEYRWVIDPLDGTTNYAHGYPAFCVSIALEKAAKVVLGVIFNPLLNETFVAEVGKGAFLNGERLGVSSTASVAKGLFATGFPYDLRENPNNNINYFVAMSRRAQAIRRAGSAALELAYTAAGRFDGFWELRLRPWDTAAGCLMIKEAGGRVSDLYGEEHDLDAPAVVASNGIIHEEMLSILGRTDPFSAED